jgi:hypothetical protein
MPLGIFVVFHIAGFGRVDSVVPALGAILARKPVRASLSEDDVAWDDILLCSFHGSLANEGEKKGKEGKDTDLQIS